MHRQVHALARNMVGREDADDVAQECFLAVHAALPSFRGEAKVSTWVYRIAIRIAIERRARRARRHFELPITEPTVDGERLAISRDELARVERAIARLPAAHRTVIALSVVEGMTHAEIADVLGVPEGTIWSRLARARETLAETVERS
jgi:RNA polymerase sigma-70 factor, ECF subfamily